MDADWLKRVSPCVNIAGGVSQWPGWLDPKRVIYDHELMLFGTGGHFRIDVGDAAYEFRGPGYIIIPPGVWHVCRGLESDGIARAWVHFDWVFQPVPPQCPILTYAPARPVGRLYRQPPAFVPAGILHADLAEAAWAFELHARIAERFNRGAAAEKLSSRALLLELLVRLLVGEEHGAAARRPAVADAGRVREELNRLAQQPFASAGRIRDTLAGLGQSYDHQARLFKAAYGVTPLQYVNTLRVERAAGLLRDTGESVAQVGRRLGFRDPVYFGRLFRRLTGKTPSQARA
jgi:AraC-like DNA-binding protein